MIDTLDLEPLRPPRSLRHAHAQTIAGSLLPSRGPRDSGAPHNVELPDGDRLCVICHRGDKPWMVHLWHGLGGHADSGYVLRAARWLGERGFHVLRGNHRGCGVGRSLARQPYHSGRSDDLAEVLAYGRKQWPDLKHIVVGFSLSGNALLLLLGKGGVALPEAAISVNAPIDLALCSESLKRGMNQAYDFRFSRLCRQAVRQREIDGLTDTRTRFPWRTTLQRFDDLYTAPFGGFKDRHDYYSSCSAGPWLKAIQTPTVMITAEDDPMVPFITYAETARSDMVRLHTEEAGGHMGYLNGRPTPLGTRRWLDYAVVAWVEAFVERL